MLLRAPEGWPQPVVAVVAMLLLAVLDLAGSLAGKEAVERRSVALALVGAGLFLAVFWVYISSLEVAELSAVTFGWVVVLQVGVVLLDRFRYGVIPAPGTWLAIAVLLAAQADLILAPAATPAAAETAVPAPVQAAVPALSVQFPETGDGSAQRGDQSVEAGHQEAAEIGDGQRPDGDRADQQSLTDGLVSRVLHVSPHPDATASTAATSKEYER